MIGNENNLVDFIEKFRNDGYSDYYTVENKHLKSVTTGEVISDNNFNIDVACKFDITENATDQQYLFGINTPKGKGLLVDLLGNYLFDNYELFDEKLEKIEIESHLVEEEKDLKYGLPKIYKVTFEENPERFELREGYPDFPTCPFDQTFKALGYDKKKEEYVWLVTSIIRDKRLKRVAFNA